MSWTPELEELEKRKALAAEMGGAERVQRQHDAGRLTIRERVDRLVDTKSFHEIGAIAGMAEYDEHSDLTDLHARELHFRPREDRRPHGGRRRRRFHGARRIGGRLDPREADDGRRHGAAVPPADHPRHRGIGRRWLGEDHRDQGPRQSARAGRRDARLSADDGIARRGADGRPRPRLGCGPRRGASHLDALFRDDEEVRDVRRRSAGRRASRAGSQQGGSRRLAGADAQRRDRPCGRDRGRSLRMRAQVPVLSAFVGL